MRNAQVRVDKGDAIRTDGGHVLDGAARRGIDDAAPLDEALLCQRMRSCIDDKVFLPARKSGRRVMSSVCA